MRVDINYIIYIGIKFMTYHYHYGLKNVVKQNIKIKKYIGTSFYIKVFFYFYYLCLLQHVQFKTAITLIKTIIDMKFFFLIL